MSIFDDLLAGSGQVFLNAFGESVVYYPAGGDDGRNITAVIDRQGASDVGQVNRSTSPVITIEVLNDAASGISSSEFDGGLDVVKLAVRLGVSPTRKRINKILTQDSEMVKYEVQ